MSGTEYPQEVWAAIKVLWESSPKISWRECLEMVSDQLQTEVPSIVAVTRRAKREQWKKKVKNIVKKPIKKARKPRQNLTLDASINLNPDEQLQDDENAEDLSLNEGLKNTEKTVKNDIKKIDITPVMIMAEDAVQEAALVIHKFRTRSRRIGELVDGVLDNMDDINLKIKNSKDRAFSEENAKTLQNQMSFTAGTVELVEKLTKSLDKLASVEFATYGLKDEDFKDKQSKNRLDDISDDTVYEQERELAKLRFEQAKARAAEIESPDFEATLRAEMEAEGVVITGEEEEA